MNKFLIVGPAWVGDMVMAQALFMQLRHDNPNSQIDVIAPTWTLDLLKRMPEVNHAIPMPIGHGQLALLERYRIGKQLRQAHYDQTILLPNSFKSALIPFWARIKKRTGFIGEMRYGLLNDWRKLDKEQLPRTIDRFVALGLAKTAVLNTREVCIPQLQSTVEQQQQSLTNLKIHYDPNKPVLALCPGAEFGPAKRWPIEHFVTTAKHYFAQGFQIWLFGSNKDRTITDKINSECDNACLNLAGKTTLGEAIDLLALASVVITNDSGLMHIACALNRPVIAIYGSSSPGFTPPLNDKAKVLSLNLACSPCFQRECPLQHLNCLRLLLPEKIITAVNEALAS